MKSVIEMAKDAGFMINLLVDIRCNRHQLERFAALVREECAKVCESNMDGNDEDDDGFFYNRGAEDCAAAIRARGEK